MGGGDCQEAIRLFRARSANEVYLVEGDSAGGTANKVVIVISQFYHCGKILNVEKAMHHKVLKTREEIYLLHLGLPWVQKKIVRH
jgi:DNA gyrase/topoisomerase IV subunit B